jgi:hypothetical protein
VLISIGLKIKGAFAVISPSILKKTNSELSEAERSMHTSTSLTLLYPFEKLRKVCQEDLEALFERRVSYQLIADVLDGIVRVASQTFHRKRSSFSMIGGKFKVERKIDEMARRLFYPFIGSFEGFNYRESISPTYLFTITNTENQQFIQINYPIVHMVRLGFLPKGSFGLTVSKMISCLNLQGTEQYRIQSEEFFFCQGIWSDPESAFPAAAERGQNYFQIDRNVLGYYLPYRNYQAQTDSDTEYKFLHLFIMADQVSPIQKILITPIYGDVCVQKKGIYVFTLKRQTYADIPHKQQNLSLKGIKHKLDDLTDAFQFVGRVDKSDSDSTGQEPLRKKQKKEFRWKPDLFKEIILDRTVSRKTQGKEKGYCTTFPFTEELKEAAEKNKTTDLIQIDSDAFAYLLPYKNQGVSEEEKEMGTFLHIFNFTPREENIKIPRFNLDEAIVDPGIYVFKV